MSRSKKKKKAKNRKRVGGAKGGNFTRSSEDNLEEVSTTKGLETYVVPKLRLT